MEESLIMANNRFIDLTGKKINHLLILKRFEKDSNEVYWECLCDCGNIKITTTYYLRNNICRSCGCKNKYKEHLLKIGEKYNLLTVIKDVNKNGRRHWLCKCDCGNETILNGTTIVKGKTKSCGCLKKAKPKCTYVMKNDYVLGCTEKGKEFLIDIDDLPLIEKYNWIGLKSGYFKAYINNKNISMHNFIMPRKKGYVIDHINRCKNDNRKSNLRYANHFENAENRSISSNNTSGKTGVYYNKKSKKWVASIGLNGSRTYLGTYLTKDEAIKARINAENKYYGEFTGEI
jgi:hypothetical protein